MWKVNIKGTNFCFHTLTEALETVAELRRLNSTDRLFIKYIPM